MAHESGTDKAHTRLDAERIARGLNYTALGKALGVQRAASRRYCLGLQTPKRGKHGKPGPAEKLAAWSGGHITILNFDDPPPAAKPSRAKRKART